MAYATSDINDFYEVFVLGIIGDLLTDGPNAPFYKSLLESGMGQNFPAKAYHRYSSMGAFLHEAHP